MNVKHSYKSDSWMTPNHIIDKVRNVMGVIELDPATSVGANQRIRAKWFFTEEDDALSLQTWCDIPLNIFINPPGGKRGNKSLPSLFWAKLMDHWDKGLVSQAIFLGFSMEQLSVSQNYHLHAMTDFVVCVPRKRIQFIDPNSNNRMRSPTHANVIVYVPGHVDRTELFEKEFSDLGRIMHGVHSRRLRNAGTY